MRFSLSLVLVLLAVLTAITPVMAQPQTMPPCMYTQVDRSMFGADDSVRVYMVPSYTANCGAIDVDVEGNFGYSVVVKFVPVGDSVSTKEFVTRYLLGSDRRVKVKEVSTDELSNGDYVMETYVGGEVTPSSMIFLAVAKGGDTQVQSGFVVRDQLPRLSRASLPFWSTSPVSKISGVLYVRMRSEGSVRGFLYQNRSDRTVVLPIQFDPVSQRVNAWYNWGSYGSLIDNPWMRSASRIPANGVFQDGVPVYLSLTTSDGITVQGVLFDGTGAVNFEGWNQ